VSCFFGSQCICDKVVMSDSDVPVGRLLELISGDTVPVELKVEAVVILGSLAKGPDHVVHSVFDSGIMPLLLKGNLALLNIQAKYLFVVYFCMNFNAVYYMPLSVSDM